MAHSDTSCSAANDEQVTKSEPKFRQKSFRCAICLENATLTVLDWLVQ